MLQLILIVKLVTCEMHSKIKFFNQKPTNEIGRPHYTPLVIIDKDQIKKILCRQRPNKIFCALNYKQRLSY